jgi:RNA polymerase sigma-70 factor (ECF subfamily)
MERPATVAAGPISGPTLEELDDLTLVECARKCNEAAFRLILERYNQRLYRVARGVLGDDTEAEDVLQESYIRAFTHLSQFRGEARLSTWLTRIVLNEALQRLRKKRTEIIDAGHNGSAFLTPVPSHEPDPETSVAMMDIRCHLERAVAALPLPFRIVFVMRDVEEMAIDETALVLGLRPQTVSTRLHRARRLLRQALQDKLATALNDVFYFAGARCARLTLSTFNRLSRSNVPIR